LNEHVGWTARQQKGEMKNLIAWPYVLSGRVYLEG